MPDASFFVGSSGNFKLFSVACDADGWHGLGSVVFEVSIDVDAVVSEIVIDFWESVSSHLNFKILISFSLIF